MTIDNQTNLGRLHSEFELTRGLGPSESGVVSRASILTNTLVDSNKLSLKAQRLKDNGPLRNGCNCLGTSLYLLGLTKSPRYASKASLHLGLERNFSQINSRTPKRSGDLFVFSDGEHSILYLGNGKYFHKKGYKDDDSFEFLDEAGFRQVCIEKSNSQPNLVKCYRPQSQWRPQPLKLESIDAQWLEKILEYYDDIGDQKLGMIYHLYGDFSSSLIGHLLRTLSLPNQLTSNDQRLLTAACSDIYQLFEIAVDCYYSSATPNPFADLVYEVPEGQKFIKMVQNVAELETIIDPNAVSLPPDEDLASHVNHLLDLSRKNRQFCWF